MAKLYVAILVTIALGMITGAAGFDFTGRYKLVNSENYNEFLKELGLGYFKRLAATSASSAYDISVNEETKEITFRTIATFGDSMIKFQDDVMFDENRSDGKTVKSKIRINDNKWEQTQTDTDGNVVTIIREFKDDGKIIVTSTTNGVSAVRTYEKQN